MKEIKFRAWDGKDMLNIDHWTLSMINQHIPENHIIMQYTGLKDKNGEEIYEEDIIQTYDSKTLKIKVGRRIVQWNVEHCWLESHYINEDTAEQFDKFYVKDFGVEIIGNIHQHSCLLEDADYDESEVI